jgi:NDP-sugar pyrophosphorylase family protein
VQIDPEDSQRVVDAITYPGINDGLATQGAYTNNADRLYTSDYYTWDPFVDFDKFVVSEIGQLFKQNINEKDQKKIEQLKQLKEISDFPGIHYVRQKEPMGLGDAILKAEKHIGNEPFAVLLGDDIIANGHSCIGQLISIFSRFHASVISIEPVSPEKVSSYGIIKGSAIEPDLFIIEDIIEKVLLKSPISGIFDAL